MRARPPLSEMSGCRRPRATQALRAAGLKRLIPEDNYIRLAHPRSQRLAPGPADPIVRARILDSSREAPREAKTRSAQTLRVRRGLCGFNKGAVAASFGREGYARLPPAEDCARPSRRGL